MRILVLIILMFECNYLNCQKASERNDTSLNSIIRGVDYYFAGDYIKAQQEYINALDLRMEFYGPNHVSLAHAYNNLGLVAMKTWSYENAIELLHKAENIYLHDQNSKIDLATTYSNLGRVYKLQGEYSLAEQYVNRALKILQPIHDAEAYQRLSETYLNFGSIEMEKGNFKNAIVFYKESIPKFNYFIEPVTYHNLYKNISTAYLLLNNTDSCYIYLKKSLEYAKSTKNLPQYFYASSLIGLARYNIKLNKKEEAFAFLKKAKGIYQSIEIDSSIIFGLNNEFAYYYNSFKEFESALEYYQKFINYLTRKKIKDFYFTPNAELFIEPTNGISILKKKSECMINWYKQNSNSRLLNASLQSLLVASELIDKARNGYLTMESKLAIAENEASIYKMGIWCAYQLYSKTCDIKYLENAFYFAEKGKSSVLEASLQEEKAKSFAGIPDSLLAKEKKLKREITFYNQQIYDEKRRAKPDNAKLTSWNNYLFEFTKQQESLKTYLEKNFSDYYRLKYTNTTINIKKVQETIDKKTSVIEYTLSDSLMYIIYITKNNSNIYCVTIDSSFYKQTLFFIDQFRNFNYLAQGQYIVSDFEKLSSSIFNYLIKPAENNSLKENLIIIPDDILSYLPFETLTMPNQSGNKTTYADLHYIFLNHSVSYSYSSSLLCESSKNTRRKLLNRLLAIAPDYNLAYTNALRQYNSNKSLTAVPVLESLPFAMEEVKSISSITYGNELTGNNATLTNFVHSASSYDILHLAMHTLIDDNNPLYSKFVFTKTTSDTNTNLLTTNEIFGLKLKAQLAVLSACSSGEGELKKGEGVLSLARGFFYAGCPSLVMTLWKVEDESGLYLMKSFYKYLLKGYTKPQALQKAKFGYLESVPQEKQHPFYWSSYICIGNPAPIFFPRWITGSILIFVLLNCYFIIRYLKKNKTRKLNEPAV